MDSLLLDSAGLLYKESYFKITGGPGLFFFFPPILAQAWRINGELSSDKHKFSSGTINETLMLVSVAESSTLLKLLESI